MTVSAPIVISEHAQVKFDVLGESTCKIFKAASAFVEGLLTVVERTDLIFTEVVTCRTVVLQKDNGVIRHELRILADKGPFNSEQFLEMMQYNSEISNEEWAKHVSKFTSTK